MVVFSIHVVYNLDFSDVHVQKSFSPSVRDRPIFHTDLQIRTPFRLPTHPPLNLNIHDQKKIGTPVDFHLSIKCISNRKFTNGNNTLIGIKKKLKMKEQCDEILKQYGISGCTDFSFPLKSEHLVSD